jgi:hypothetical protein
MKHLHLCSPAWFLLAMLAFAAWPQAARSKSSDCLIDPVSSCASNEYDVVLKMEDGRACPKCLHMSEPPAPASLWCYVTSSTTYYCEAYPTGSSISYTWQTSGEIGALPPPWWSNAIEVQCHSGSPNSWGTLTVTVTSPFGLNAQAEAHLACDGMAEL